MAEGGGWRGEGVWMGTGKMKGENGKEGRHTLTTNAGSALWFVACVTETSGATLSPAITLLSGIPDSVSTNSYFTELDILF
jgi:hypothetical protein